MPYLTWEQMQMKYLGNTPTFQTQPLFTSRSYAGTTRLAPNVQSSGVVQASQSGSQNMAAAAYIVPAAISAAASIWGASKQASTTRDVTRQQIAAQQQASAMEDVAAQRQLDFLRESDAADRKAAEILRQQNWGLSEADRRTNYDLTTTTGLNNYNMTEAQRRQLYNTNETERGTTYGNKIARQELLNPFVAGGTTAFNKLSHVMGLAPGPVTQTTLKDPKSATPWIDNPYNKAPDYVKADYTSTPYLPLPTGTQIPTTIGAPQTETSGGTAPSTPRPAGVQSLASVATGRTPDDGTGMVKMRGPDGSLKIVPATQAPYFQSLGAVIMA